MAIRLITFDLDDTLWHTAPVLQAAEAALLDWLARHAPRLQDAPRQLARQRQRLLAAEPGLAVRISQLRRRMLQACLEEAGYPADTARVLGEQAFQQFLAARQQVTLFPEVRPLLQHLAQRHALGVLTNGNADIGCIGLGEYFAFAFSAEMLGIGKPDPQVFRTALARLNLEACEAVHVGDHPLDDIHGAQQAGLRAVWFNPRGLPWTGERDPDGQIQRLDELPALLERWHA